MSFSLLTILPLAALLIWLILNAREKSRASQNLPRHSGLRLVFAAIGILTVLFSGGCGLIFGIAELMRQRSGAADDFMSWQLVAIFSLPPLIVGSLFWWLSMRRNPR